VATSSGPNRPPDQGLFGGSGFYNGAERRSNWSTGAMSWRNARLLRGRAVYEEAASHNTFILCQELSI
jgi:hypothetical protein